MNEVLQNILSRRSYRSFEERPIAKEDLDLILQAAIYAPSGMNRQSWQFTVLQTPAQIETLAAAMRPVLQNDGYNFYRPAVLILASNECGNSNGLADCACALQNIFLEAEALGIGSCWINQLKDCCDDPAVREVLTRFGVPETLHKGEIRHGKFSNRPKRQREDTANDRPCKREGKNKQRKCSIY